MAAGYFHKDVDGIGNGGHAQMVRQAEGCSMSRVQRPPHPIDDQKIVGIFATRAEFNTWHRALLINAGLPGSDMTKPLVRGTRWAVRPEPDTAGGELAVLLYTRLPLASLPATRITMAEARARGHFPEPPE
jgi:hypothetical protein